MADLNPEYADSRPPLALVALVVLAGWIIPGGGYFISRQFARGIVVCITVLTLFVGGLAIGGIRVLDVPGYKDGFQNRVDPAGRHVDPHDPGYSQATWTMQNGGAVGEVLSRIWYLPQLMAGPVAILASYESIDAAQRQVAATHARVMEIGTLYTVVAGMLNLLTIMDAAARTGEPVVTRGLPITVPPPTRMA